MWQAVHNESRKWPWAAVYKNTFITGMACWLSVNMCSHLLGGSPAVIPSLQFAFTSWANDNQKMRQLLSWPNLIQKKLDDSCTHPSVKGCFKNLSKMHSHGPQQFRGVLQTAQNCPVPLMWWLQGNHACGSPTQLSLLPQQHDGCKHWMDALTSGMFSSVWGLHVVPSKPRWPLISPTHQTDSPEQVHNRSGLLFIGETNASIVHAEVHDDALSSQDTPTCQTIPFCYWNSYLHDNCPFKGHSNIS